MQKLKLFLKLIIIFLKINFRDSKKLISLLFISFLITFIYSFSFKLYSFEKNYFIHGIVWTVLIFSSTSIFSNSFTKEYENNILILYRLFKIDYLILFFSKVFSNFFVMFFLELLVLPLIIILFNINLNINYYFILIFLLGNFAYILVTTFFSFINLNSNIITIIIYPLLIPLFMALLKTSYFIFINNLNSNFFFWLKLLIAFNIIYMFIILILLELFQYEKI